LPSPARQVGEIGGMQQLTVSGVEIAYLDEGNGPAIIIGHCSSASHKEWLPLIAKLPIGVCSLRTSSVMANQILGP